MQRNRTYKKIEIEKWKRECEDVPVKIDALQQANTGLREKLDVLVAAKNKLLTEDINPLNSQILALEARINQLVLPQEISRLADERNARNSAVEKIRAKIHNLDASLTAVNVEIAKLELAIEVSELNNRQAVLRKEIQTYESSRVQCLRNQELYDKTISRLTGDIKTVTDTLAQQQEQAANVDVRLGDLVDTCMIQGRSLEDKLRTLQAEVTSVREDRQLAIAAIQNIDKALGDLKQEFSAIHEELNSRYRQVDGYPVNDKPLLEIMLRGKNTEREPVVAGLNHQYNALREETTSLNKINDMYDEKYSMLSSCNELAKAHADNTSLDNLRMQLHDRTSRLDVCNKELISLTNTIDQRQRAMEANIQEIADFQQRLDAMRQHEFMQKYHFNPRALVDHFSDSVCHTLTAFENDHPAGLHRTVRIWLLDLSRQLNVIMKEPGNALKDIRAKYNRAAGLVWHAINQTELHDPLFAARLREVVLGEECLDRLEAVSDYALFMYLRHIDCTTPEQLRDRETLQFNLAQVKLANRLQDLPQGADLATRQMYHAGQKLLNVIRQQRTRQGQSFDARYYTTVLNTSSDLLANPTSLDLQNKMSDLAQHNHHGNPSRPRKIMGAMLFFLGAAMVLTGVGLAVGTFGIASPIALPLIGSGAVIATAGAFLFGYGCQRGISKRLENFELAVKRAPLQQGLFAHHRYDEERVTQAVAVSPMGKVH